MRQRITLSIIFSFLVLSLAFSQEPLKIYGYGSLYFEKASPWSNAPAGTKGDPGEVAFSHLNIMMQKNITDKIKFFVNLAAPDAQGVIVRNFWGEYAFSDMLKLRVGKIYRPFDQFNELLDAAPTYLGMEPPEIYDKDHLMLPRTGKIMLHGAMPIGSNFLKYSYMLDSDEQFKVSDGSKITLSHGWDVKFSMLDDKLTIGHSGYLGNERNGTEIGLGQGSPNGGVLPWMATDKYSVFGGYFNAKIGNISLMGGYTMSQHKAVRDTGAILTLFANTSLNAAQDKNFFGSTAGAATHTGADVVTSANYTVTAYYIRLGYTITKDKVPFELGEITPYVFFEGYSNPETIAEKTWGGDNEAGWADDGVFYKPTVGLVFKPAYNMALKLDFGPHIFKSGGQTVKYNEFRTELSFMF